MASVRSDEVATVLDGPRLDVADITTLWLDRFGAPRRIRDALGQETSLDRTNPTFPALVTRVRSPSGHVATTGYDAKGRVTSSLSARGDGVTPQPTRYAWNDAVDQVDTITSGTDKTVIEYDPVTGNRLWQQVGLADSTRVHFAYNRHGQVTETWTQQSPLPQKFNYDSTTFNLVRVTTPEGRRTEMVQDHLGRDTLVTSPMQGALRIRTRTRYDAADRPDSVVTTAPSVGDGRHDTQTLTVRTYRDREGADTLVVRTMDPDPNGIWHMWTKWFRDAAGRVTSEGASGGAWDYTEYDAAGLVTSYTPRQIGGGDVQTHGPIRMRYDALGRLVERIVPAMTYETEPLNTMMDSNPYPRYSLGGDTWIPGRLPGDTIRLTYDVTGGIAVAANREAIVWRSYWLDGALRTDSTAMRAWDGPGYQHVFGISHTYDVQGRRRFLHYPSMVGAGARVDYAYHPHTGALKTLTALGGHAFHFGYNGNGQLTELRSPADITESTSYTDDGQVHNRHITVNNDFVDDPVNGLASALRSETFTYDARGKVWQVTGNVGNVPATTTSNYAPMGGLASIHTSKPYNWQTLTVDALGNTVVNEAYSRNEEVGGSRTIQTHTYLSNGTGRLVSTLTLDPQGWFVSRDTTMYDQAGNRTRHSTRSLLRWEEMNGYGNDKVAVALDESTRSYYDAEGRLRAVDRRRCVGRAPEPVAMTRVVCVGWEPAPGRDPSVFEEYRYDALGRRIAVRTRPDASQCSITRPEPCMDRVTRTVWDGDQLLLELRATGGSTDSHGEWVAYTQGPGIDAPLMVRARRGDTHDIIPLANWRGLYEAGVFPDGSTYRETLDLKQISWPAANYTAYFDYIPDEDDKEPVWLGSLMSHKRDASGQLYMRNRYFDPASGRFTQEDPIGMAGGLNLYGFGGGDPVNYTDPYGLKADTVWVGTRPLAVPGAGFIINHSAVRINNDMFVTRPDTLRRIGGEYRRDLPQRRYVWFDSAGRHRRTENRLGQQTVFWWSEGRLTRLQVPPDTIASYAFEYVAGKLVKVVAPGGRETRFAATPSALLVTDPDSSTVRFAYGPRQRITGRRDRRGLITSYGFGPMGLLSRSGFLAGPDSTVIRYAPAEGAGAMASVRSDEVALAEGRSRSERAAGGAMWTTLSAVSHRSLRSVT